ncbi:MAG: SpoIIE family protein phosphatase [Verrucomicrobia bacterium]|nr:SpoIIE family protein phosphatase [Verrucomicrobiota bacterium]
MNFIALLLLIGGGYFAYQWWLQSQRTHLVQASRRHLIQERQRVLSFLHDVGEAFTENLKVEEILKLIIQCSVRTAEAKSGAIFLLDASLQNLEAVVIEGPFPPPHPPAGFMESKLTSRAVFLEQAVKSQKISMGDGILGGVAQAGKPVLIRNPKEDSRLPHYDNEILRIHTFLAVPLVFRDQILGVMAMANTKDEKSFDDEDLSLVTSLASQAAFAIFNANLHQMLAEKERVDRDLEIAREIQQLLLPSSFPVIEGVQVSALNIPALKVGGDYYDFVRVDADHWGFAIADVSGKGVSGALIMAMCRSALRTKAVGHLSPSQVLKEVNRVIHPDMREDMFISMIYGVLNVPNREFNFCRAGHEALLLHRGENGQGEALAPRGMALGIDNGTVFDSVLQEQRVSLQRGDAVVFYTDGITEALDETGQEFGRNQLIEAIHACADQSAQEMARNIEQRVRRFVGQHPQSDDITLLVVRT